MADTASRIERDWHQCLTREQYRVLREKGTEAAFAGQYCNCHDKGIYLCAACGNELFGSDAKFDSGTGWPTFSGPLHPDSIHTQRDRSYGMVRTEVVCAQCGSHLGHVFDDGPEPTGLRYCMNSVSLVLKRET